MRGSGFRNVGDQLRFSYSTHQAPIKSYVGTSVHMRKKFQNAALRWRQVLFSPLLPSPGEQYPDQYGIFDSFHRFLEARRERRKRGKFPPPQRAAMGFITQGCSKLQVKKSSSFPPADLISSTDNRGRGGGSCRLNKAKVRAGSTVRTSIAAAALATKLCGVGWF